jgi:hypothetical protein
MDKKNRTMMETYNRNNSDKENSKSAQSLPDLLGNLPHLQSIPWTTT